MTDLAAVQHPSDAMNTINGAVPVSPGSGEPEDIETVDYDNPATPDASDLMGHQPDESAKPGQSFGPPWLFHCLARS